METGYIYTITNTVNGKKYVGQAVNYKNRWKQHKKALEAGTHPNKYLQNSYNKYGADAFVYKVIAVVDLNVLDESEVLFIKQFDSYRNGYNLTIGGEGARGTLVSEEVRKATAKRVSGANNHSAKLTDEQRVIIYKDDVNPSSFWAEKFGVTVQAINGVRAGRYSTHITKQFNDEGYYHPMHLHYLQGKAKDTKGRNKIAQMDIVTGEIIKIWDSIKHANIEGGFQARCLSRCCTNQQYSHRGYRWRIYKDDEGAE